MLVIFINNTKKIEEINKKISIYEYLINCAENFFVLTQYEQKERDKKLSIKIKRL